MTKKHVKYDAKISVYLTNISDISQIVQLELTSPNKKQHEYFFLKRYK